MVTYTEKELHFTFPDDLNWIELDKRGNKLPIGMMFVDLVIERDLDILMVEIKDPSHTRTPKSNRTQYLLELKSNEKISKELTPKIRDSFTFMHLMKKDIKPMKYIVLLGLDAFDIKTQKELLGNFKDRLFRNIKQEADVPWAKEYLQDCMVMNIDIWNTSFPQWQVTRISQQPQAGAN